MATLEKVSYIGSKRAKYHLEKGFDEIDFLVDVGGKTKGSQQAKFIYKKVKDLQSLTYEIDSENLREELTQEELIQIEKLKKADKRNEKS